MKKLKHSLYILFFLLFATSLVAQPDWQWGQEVHFKPWHIAVDNYGNSYVTWTLQDPYEIDGTLFISNGSADAALTSFDCNGVHRWTKIIGGSGGDRITGLGTDTLGGVYVTLSVNGVRIPNYNTSFAPDTTINSGQKGLLLVKYNTEGDMLWLRMPEDTVVFNLPDDLQIGTSFDLDVSPNGDCYIYSKLSEGSYSNGAFEATFPGTLDDGEDIYILKYDGEGNFASGVHFDMWYSGATLNRGSFNRDHYTGKYYRSGYLSGNDEVIFGGEEVTANNYVVQFDSSGFVNWNFMTDDVKFLGKPSVDEFGNVYVTGGTSNGNSLGDFTFQNTFGSSGFPVFAKFDSLANVIYATNASVDVNSGGFATSYSNMEVAVAGRWGSLISWGDELIDNTNSENQGFNVFLALFDAEGQGMPESIHTLTSSPMGAEEPSLLTADTQGNFYVGGHFSGQLYVGDGTLYNQTGTQEGFIAKFGSDSCYCPLPVSLFTYDSIPNQAGY
ncbi:hypothetical protein G3O08_20610, partial [Cryomorpha ignava]